MKEQVLETKILVATFDELSSQQQLLVQCAKEQVFKAYAPYSEFHVGAAVLLANGEIFAGSNQENAAYPSGLCAERVALFFANAQHPSVAVKSIAIAAFYQGEFVKSPVTPCGSCRQVILESETRFKQEIEIILYGSEALYLIKNVKQLLPLCFEQQSLSI
ncbi:MAG: cytidine deaminase [Porphyromonadaceae bacterium CG2_30_38_12]|nr:MAG: cytidine deaminase [Porphyromonadaceae bacterium CG2_30_38_12]